MTISALSLLPILLIFILFIVMIVLLTRQRLKLKKEEELLNAQDKKIEALENSKKDNLVEGHLYQ